MDFGVVTTWTLECFYAAAKKTKNLRKNVRLVHGDGMAYIQCQLSHASLSALLVAETWAQVRVMLEARPDHALSARMIELGDNDQVSPGSHPGSHACIHACCIQCRGASASNADTVHDYHACMYAHCIQCEGASEFNADSTALCRITRPTRQTTSCTAWPLSHSSALPTKRQCAPAIWAPTGSPRVSCTSTRKTVQLHSNHMLWCLCGFASVAIAQYPSRGGATGAQRHFMQTMILASVWKRMGRM